MARLKQRFPAGEPVFREGEAGDQAFLIKSGRVAITVDRAGEPLRLATLGPGEIFGEMALIDDRLRSATATPVEETEALVVDHDTVHELLEEADPLLRLLLQVLIKRFRSTQSRLTTDADAPPIGAGAAAEDEAAEASRETAERLKLADALTEAVSRDEFALAYQPVVALDDGRPVGAEALIRWHHPDRGLIGPGEFMPFAEESSAIDAIGAWVIQAAAAAEARFRDAVPDAPPHGTDGAPGEAVRPGAVPPFVSFNVAPKQLHAAGFADRVERLLAASRARPERLKLEITERLLMSDPERAAEVLDRLKGLGLRIALDDFGTGYSSLNYLHRFPIDTLKIDRSFVRRMREDRTSHSIVRAVIGLSDALGVEVIAEGVETPAQADALRALGCPMAQGFRYARPLRAEDCERAFASGRLPGADQGPG